jgi:hypothetical protein
MDQNRGDDQQLIDGLAVFRAISIGRARMKTKSRSRSGRA